MTIVEHVVALLQVMRPADLESMSPARRQDLAQQLRHWAALAEARQEAKTGVLAQVHRDRCTD